MVAAFPQTLNLPDLKRTFGISNLYLVYFYGRYAPLSRVKYLNLVSEEVNADAGVTVP